MGTIGRRVRERLLERGISQKDLASQVGMTPDALSRAINGQRGFAALELAEIAACLDTEVHYLITGEPDPHRLVLSARHTYDHATGGRHLAGSEGDMQILRDIRLAYVQALG